MTAVVALKKKFGRKVVTVIAADSLFSAGDFKLNAKDTCKLIQFPNFVVGFSGICTVQTLLKNLVKNKTLRKQKFMEMKNVFHANRFARKVFNDLDAILVESGEEHQVRQLVGELLFVTDKRIFRVDKYGFVSEFEEFTSIGCAYELTTGTLATMYAHVSTPEELKDLAEKSIEVACQYSLSCGPPITVLSYE